MRIFITEEEFVSFLPNILPIAGNEVRLLEKIDTYITAAENYAINNFTGEEVFDDICKQPVETYLHSLLSREVLSHALYNAIPAINIVVTPNGLATVGTQTLVAASHARVEALMKSMLVMRDECIPLLIDELSKNSEWRTSEMGAYFRDTLFPDFEAVSILDIPMGERWEKFQAIRPQIMQIEFRIAQEWMSEPLMCLLRAENLNYKECPPEHKILIDRLRGVICYRLKTGKFPEQVLRDLVDFIRKKPKSFPEWHESETSKLFSPPIFHNDKKSAGYFF